MRSPSRGVGALVAALVAALPVGMTPVYAAADAGGTVGGPLLGSRGIVEQPLPGAPRLPSGLTSRSWVVADLTTGQVLAARDPHGRFLPASTMKTLAAATLIPRLSPSMMVRADERDAGVDGTRVGLVPGFRYSVYKLFQSMLAVSANDAADALAEANGGIRRTVDEMNAEAASLQADDTHADTPSGLDGPGETTSAYDLALIARHDFALPAFRRYVQTVHARMPAPHHKHYAIYTHNYLLTTFRGDIGGKNGYTVAAHATYMGAATRGGHTIVVTLMRANPDFWPEARALLDWGFAAEGRVTPVGQLVGPRMAAAAPVASRPPSGSGAGLHASGTTTTVGDRRHDGELAALGLSLVVLVAVLTRRRRGSRNRRLTLPSR